MTTNLRKTLGLNGPKPVASKGAGKPPSVEAEAKVIITHTCGHKSGVRYLRQQACAGCIYQRRRERQQRPGKRKPPRLPDGASFIVRYHATAEKWRGTLTVGTQVFEAEAPAVFHLLAVLDAMYRKASTI